MAVSGVIGNGVIQIALKGFEAVSAQLQALKDRAKGAVEGLNGITTMAAGGFVAAKASIMGLVAAADPVRFQIFTTHLQILSLHIGRIFIPILEDAINWVDKLIVYFRNLTDDQREQILKWTEVALKILGVGFAIKTLTTLFGPLISAVKLFGAVLSGAGPIGLLLALAAALIGVGEASGKFNLGETLLPILGMIQDVVAPLLPLFQELGRVLGDLLQASLPILQQLLSLFMAVGKVVSQIFVASLKAILPILTMIIETVTLLTKSFWDAFGDTIIAMVENVKSVVEYLAKIIMRIVNAAKDLIDLVNELDPDTAPSGSLVKGMTKSALQGGGRGAAGNQQKKKKPAQSNRFSPLMKMSQPQWMGVEEVFKKAQTAAGFDPTKQWQQEMLNEAKDGNRHAEITARNTTPRNPAQVTP